MEMQSGTRYSDMLEFMRRYGPLIPPDMGPPTEAEISAVVNRMFNSESTQKAAWDMLGALGCRDFDSLVRTVVNNVRSKPAALIDPTKLVYIKSGDIS